MFGQGSPNFQRYLIAIGRRQTSSGMRSRYALQGVGFVAIFLFATLISQCIFPSVAHAQGGMRLSPASEGISSDLKLRFAWGGGLPQKWSGRITIENGSFVDSRPLAITADSPSTVVRRKQELIINHRIATSYGGVDVALVANDTSTIRMSIEAADGITWQRTWKLNEISAGVNESIDQQQNRLSVSRSPGDQIRVNIKRPHLVFEPGESWQFETGLQRSTLGEQKARANFYWQQGNTRVPIASTSTEISGDVDGTSESKDIEVKVPDEEGVHNLLIEIEPETSITSFSQFLRSKKLSRCIQIVVVSDSPPETVDAEFWEAIETWNPQQLRGGFRNAWPRLPGSNELIRKGEQSIVNVGGDSTEPALQLRPNASLSIPIQFPDGETEAGPIRVSIRYRSIPGTKLGVNYLSSTQQVLHGIDSGVALSVSPAGIEPEEQWLTHRFYIWPEDNPGRLFVSNDSQTKAAEIGEIRLETGPSRLPQPNTALTTASPSFPSQRNRKRMAFLESPDFSGLFQSQRKVDPQTGQALDDWNTFYDSIDRLTQHLKANSWDGAYVTIAADGSAICPMAGLASGPRFDSGIFSSGGCDPIQKDVVELMLRMFDREGLALVPVLTLNSTLEPLESLREAELMSFDLVGEDGNRVDFDRSLVPTYNPLDRTLQGFCTQGIVRLTNRYKDHRSFAGIALTCRPDCCTLLPGSGNGLDNITVQRFLAAQNLDASNFNAASLVKRGDPNREAWLTWRSQEMQAWFIDILNKAGCPLYLLPVDIYNRHEVVSAMSPSLRRSGNFGEAMKEMGLDVDPATGVIVLAPRQVSPGLSLSRKRIEINTKQSLAAGQFFGDRNAGALFMHRGNWRSIDSALALTENEATRKQLYTPAGIENRRRYIEALRKYDCQLIVEGGASLPPGSTDETASLLQVLRSLPAARFNDIGNAQSGPVCMRQLSVDGQHWFYAINDSPWPVKVTAWLGQKRLPQVLQASSKPNGQTVPLKTLDGNDVLLQQREGRTEMEVYLEPWSIYAGVAQTNSAYNPYAIEGFDVELPEGSDSQLRKRLHQLKSKLSKAKIAKPLKTLLNGSFESFADPEKSGWEFGNHDEARFELDSADYRDGRVSLSMKTAGKPVWIRSNEIPMPTTARISVSAWFKTSNANEDPSPRISLEGTSDESDFYRYAPVGEKSGDESSLDNSWRKYVVHFDDLPADLSNIRIGFDLMSKGQVSIDQVEVFDRWFDENDSVAMTQLLASAGSQLENENTIDGGRRVLESYWVQFLDHYVGRTDKEPQRVSAKQAKTSFEIPIPQMPSFELPKIAPTNKKRVPLLQRLQRRE